MRQVALPRRLLPRLQAEGTGSTRSPGTIKVQLRQPRAATPTGENVTESAITANTVETYLRLFEIQPMFTLSYLPLYHQSGLSLSSMCYHRVSQKFLLSFL